MSVSARVLAGARGGKRFDTPRSSISRRVRPGGLRSRRPSLPLPPGSVFENPRLRDGRVSLAIRVLPPVARRYGRCPPGRRRRVRSGSSSASAIGALRRALLESPPIRPCPSRVSRAPPREPRGLVPSAGALVPWRTSRVLVGGPAPPCHRRSVSRGVPRAPEPDTTACASRALCAQRCACPDLADCSGSIKPSKRSEFPSHSDAPRSSSPRPDFASRSPSRPRVPSSPYSRVISWLHLRRGCAPRSRQPRRTARPVHTLVPRTSSSRCVNQPMLRVTSLSEIPTINDAPGRVTTISIAARTAGGSPVASNATTGPHVACPRTRVVTPDCR